MYFHAHALNLNHALNHAHALNLTLVIKGRRDRLIRLPTFCGMVTRQTTAGQANHSLQNTYLVIAIPR